MSENRLYWCNAHRCYALSTLTLNKTWQEVNCHTGSRENEDWTVCSLDIWFCNCYWNLSTSFVGLPHSGLDLRGVGDLHFLKEIPVVQDSNRIAWKFNRSLGFRLWFCVNEFASECCHDTRCTSLLSTACKNQNMITVQCKGSYKWLKMRKTRPITARYANRCKLWCFHADLSPFVIRVHVWLMWKCFILHQVCLKCWHRSQFKCNLKVIHSCWHTISFPCCK